MPPGPDIVGQRHRRAAGPRTPAAGSGLVLGPRVSLAAGVAGGRLEGDLDTEMPWVWSPQMTSWAGAQGRARRLWSMGLAREGRWAGVGNGDPGPLGKLCGRHVRCVAEPGVVGEAACV